VLTSYTNLAEAYMLSGEMANALNCIESARAMAQGERSWRAKVVFVEESANLALLAGNTSLALDTIGELEQLIWGRERAAPELGQIEKLRVFRVGHVKGAAEACAMAEETKDRFRNRNLMFYLDALSAHAWAERRAHGKLAAAVETELGVFEMAELAGKKASLTAQGFLE
jgi:hypothetical protein